jgi:hypothetical protein
LLLCIRNSHVPDVGNFVNITGNQDLDNIHLPALQTANNYLYIDDNTAGSSGPRVLNFGSIAYLGNYIQVTDNNGFPGLDLNGLTVLGNWLWIGNNDVSALTILNDWSLIY